MTSQPTKSTKKGWGSIWQGAVAGLESRLDNILAEDGAAATRQIQSATASRQTRPPDSRSPSRSKDISNARTESPLRASSDDAGRQSSHLGVSSASHVPLSTLDREASTSTSPPPSAATAISEPVATANVNVLEKNVALHQPQPSDADKLPVAEEGTARESVDVPSEDSRASLENITPQPTGERSDPVIGVAQEQHNTAEDDAQETSEDLRAQLDQARDDMEKLELQRQEELHTNLERIDALQAKLQYLSKEAVTAAKQAKSEAGDDSLEKKLAAKDEQIALLMEEGQKLSKSEVTQATTIRKLRSKMTEDSKALTEAKRKIAKQDSILSDLSSQVAMVENNQKDSLVKDARLSRFEKELATLRAEREEKQSANDSLRKQLMDTQKKVEEEQRQSNAKALEDEKKAAQSLRDDLANANIEKKLAEDRAKQELNANREELQRERERNSAAEIGLQNEISIMEGRLEILRVRTEEASTGTTNDSQAKLLRQIETLQTQYAFASENWQGIESSLQSRLTAVEKERDDAVKQEAEIRKKVRESSNTSRRLQEQYEESTRQYQILEHEATERKEDSAKSHSRISELEKQLFEAQSSFERERDAWNATLATRIEEEKAKWRQETPVESTFGRLDSPSTLYRQKSGLELPMPNARRNISRNPSADISSLNIEKVISRRSSYHPAKPLEALSPNGHDSGRSTPFLNGNLPETPSLHAMDQDDMIETSSSPQRTVNDLVSTSTAAAGPSVQLVERMSATVRRLESEKAANKEEMMRISSQRDEARQEIVSLMSEIELKRAADARVAKLEKEVNSVNERYQTTLEMLGEKSEKVDELEADVVELKNIYRELVESTIK